jgi:hypothetical protein
MVSYGQVFRGHIKIEIVQLKSIDFMTKTTVKIENDLRNSLVSLITILSGHSKEKNCVN